MVFISWYNKMKESNTCGISFREKIGVVDLITNYTTLRELFVNFLVKFTEF